MKLTVITATYSHEKYVEQSLRSSLTQETDFDYEVLVGHDCSTDGTRDILRRLERGCSRRLNVSSNETNFRLFDDYRRLLARCSHPCLPLSKSVQEVL